MKHENRNSKRSPAAKSWKKFRSNPLALSGLIFIALIAFVALAGPFIRPDDSPNANRQLLQISRQQPGFSCLVLKIRQNGPSGDHSVLESWLNGGFETDYSEIPLDSWKWDGAELVATPFGTEDELRFHAADLHYAILSPPECLSEICSIHTLNGEVTATLSDLKNKVEKECFDHRTYYLGTDKFGRDMLSRLMAGALISLSVGFIAVLISLLIGLSLGAIAGYYGGKADAAIMWLINVIWSIPTLLLVIAITFAFGKGFWKVFLAVGLTMWVEVARVVRGQFLSLREKEYAEAGKVLGFSDTRIIFRHLLPNAIGPVIVIAAANFASAILVEAGLSFLGIGAQIPIPSWGNMIKEHYNLITTDLAYLALLPGLCIMLLVLSFMLVGNGLRDAFDVRN